MNQSHNAAGEPLRGPERLEWARIALEEAVGRMVKNPDERIYVVAVTARFKELDELRAAMERRHDQIVAKGKSLATTQGATMRCPNCRRLVLSEKQHHTGERWMCLPTKPAETPAPELDANGNTKYRGVGRPRNTDVRDE